MFILHACPGLQLKVTLLSNIQTVPVNFRIHDDFFRPARFTSLVYHDPYLNHYHRLVQDEVDQLRTVPGVKEDRGQVDDVHLSGVVV